MDVVSGELLPENIDSDFIVSSLIPTFYENMGENFEVLESYALLILQLIPLLENTQRHHILVLLDSLLKINDVEIKAKAIAGFEMLLDHMEGDMIKQYVVPFVLCYSRSDFFNDRMMAVELIKMSYGKCEEGKLVLRERFLELCEDHMHFVRRKGCFFLKDMIPMFSETIVNDEILSVLNLFAEDRIDTIRSIAIDSFLSLRDVFDKEKLKTVMYPVVMNLAVDKSWRVRQSIAAKYIDILNAFAEKNDDELFEKFISLLKDKNPSVQSSSFNSISKLKGFWSQDDLLSEVVPILSDIIAAGPILMKELLSSHILTYLISFEDKELFINLLNSVLNTSNENSLVRLNIIQSVAKNPTILKINKDVLELICSRIIHTVQQCPDWNQRSLIIDQMGTFLTSVDNHYFNQHILPCNLEWLTDPVIGVRNSAINCLKIGSTYFGSNWTETQIFPTIKTILTSPHSKDRITALLTIEQLIESSNEKLMKDFYQLLENTLSDKCASIRSHICRIITKLSQQTTQHSHLKSILESLLSDEDQDVQISAYLSLKQLS